MIAKPTAGCGLCILAVRKNILSEFKNSVGNVVLSILSFCMQGIDTKAKLKPKTLPLNNDY